MAVVTTAVVAGIGTAYAVHSGEQNAEAGRRAGQRANAQAQTAETEMKNQDVAKEAAADRQTRARRQRAGQAERAGRESTILSDQGTGSTSDSAPTTLGGGEGKTLLGV